MGTCCSKPREKLSDEEYRNKIKNDFASKLKELQNQKKDEVQGESKVKETKNDDAQVSKAREIRRHGSFRAPKLGLRFCWLSTVEYYQSFNHLV